MTKPLDISGKRVFIAGHRGMVGSALMRQLSDRSCELLTVGRDQVDLRDQAATSEWIHDNRPDVIIVTAAKVGGILANESAPADFIYDNIMIAANVVEAAHQAGVDRLLYLGSSCIYPKYSEQPITEDALLTGPLEPTNQWYATAKIAGLKLVEAYRQQYGRRYISAMPTNLYGPGDNFDLQSSHVLPALIRKIHEAKTNNSDNVTIWGTGTPLREFLHVDDCASACLALLESYSGDQHVNVGSGEEISILDLAKLICETVGYPGDIKLDQSKPDGTPRKLLSSAKLKKLGWSPSIDLRDGIAATYNWFLEHNNSADSEAVSLANQH